MIETRTGRMTERRTEKMTDRIRKRKGQTEGQRNRQNDIQRQTECNGFINPSSLLTWKALGMSVSISAGAGLAAFQGESGCGAAPTRPTILWPTTKINFGMWCRYRASRPCSR